MKHEICTGHLLFMYLLSKPSKPLFYIYSVPTDLYCLHLKYKKNPNS